MNSNGLNPAGWSRLPNEVILDPAFAGLSPSAFKLYCVLLTFRNSKTGEAWPGQDTLADLLGFKGKCRRKCIWRATKSLCQAGFITIRRTHKGGVTHNYYRFPHIDRWEAENPTEDDRGGAGCPATGSRMSKPGGAGCPSDGAQRPPLTIRLNNTNEPNDNKDEFVAVVVGNSSQEEERTDAADLRGVSELLALSVDRASAVRYVETYGPERVLRAAYMASNATGISNPAGFCISLIQNGDELEPIPEVNCGKYDIPEEFDALSPAAQKEILTEVAKKYPNLNIDLCEPIASILKLRGVKGALIKYININPITGDSKE